MTTGEKDTRKLLNELSESEIEPEMTIAPTTRTRTQPWACGVFHGPGDLAKDVDRYLSSTGFGES